MAAVTTIGSGNWSSGSTVFSGGSGGGGVPTAADAVTIGRTANATIANGADALVTKSAHGLLTGDYLYWRTTGSLPTGLAINTVYYVIKNDNNTFWLSDDAGVSKIDTSSAGSGTHTYYADVITLDTTGLVALSVTVVGKMQATGGASWDLTVQNNIVQNSASWVDIDMTSDVTKTGTVTINNARAAASSTTRWYATGTSTVILKGFVKTRWTTLAASVAATDTTATVAAATGWQTGDKLCFATTQAYNATPRVDMATGTNTVSGTTISNLTALTYDHASGGYVGNFSSNLVIKPNTAGDASAVVLEQSTTARTGFTRTVTDVEFRQLKEASFPGYGVTFSVSFATADGSGLSTPYTRVGNNAFYDFRGTAGINFQALNTPVPRDNNIFYCPNSPNGSSAIYVSGTVFYCGDDVDSVVFQSAYGGILGSNLSGSVFTRPKISSCLGNGTGASYPAFALGASITIDDADIFGNKAAFSTSTNLTDINDSRIGVQYSQAASNETLFVSFGRQKLVATDCIWQTGGTFGAGITTAISGFSLQLINKGSGAGAADPAVQEIYTVQSNTVPAIQRDGSPVTGARSTSAVLMTSNATTAITHDFEVLAKAGETITVKTLVMKSGTPAYGASTLPSVTISGLGITPVVSTMAGGTAADAWETLTTQATNIGSSDGNLTVTFTAQSATAGAKAWFAGTPVAPFVSRARHYGFVFNETLPTLTTNATVSASEATAAAYTGMTVTWGSSSSSVQITASNTFQKLYDYTQAQACLNVGSAMPLTGAGVAGNPSLFAAGAVSIDDGFVLNGSGSISMGANLLSTEFAGGVNYTYTGGTWSQLTTVPTFSGGTLNLGASGTYTFTTAAATIISMTPTSPSTYVMGGGTFSGQLDLRNAAAHAITVELPAGTSYTTANNTGGVITVTTPAVYQSVTVSGITTTSRVQIYDTTSATELYNGVPGATSITWTDSVGAVATRAIRVRIADVVTVTAKNFIDANVGTCATSGAGKDVSYLATQTDDDVYNTNAIDGSTVTGITITVGPSRVNINIAGGAVTWPSIYAYQVYWQFTATGIAQETAFIAASDTANYLLTDFDVKNTHANPLTITGGWGRDSTTLTVAGCIDSAGSTGNIFAEPDHVVAFATGSALTAGQAAELTAAAGDAAAAVTAIADVPTVAEFEARTLPAADYTIVSDLGVVQTADHTAAIAALQADLPQRITKNVALAAFPFFMADSADHVTGKTGLTVTATCSIDGAAFGACANSVTEVGNGWYKIDLAAADLNGNTIAVKMTATGADPVNFTVVTQPT